MCKCIVNQLKQVAFLLLLFYHLQTHYNIKVWKWQKVWVTLTLEGWCALCSSKYTALIRLEPPTSMWAKEWLPLGVLLWGLLYVFHRRKVVELVFLQNASYSELKWGQDVWGCRCKQASSMSIKHLACNICEKNQMFKTICLSGLYYLVLTVKCSFKRWQFWNQINGFLIWSL